MSKTKQEIEQELWIEFITENELDSDNHLEQLGQFWYWYQEKKSKYKPPKVVERVVNHYSTDSGGHSYERW